jgi:hypothetical protein
MPIYLSVFLSCLPVCALWIMILLILGRVNKWNLVKCPCFAFGWCYAGSFFCSTAWERFKLILLSIQVRHGFSVTGTMPMIGVKGSTCHIYIYIGGRRASENMDLGIKTGMELVYLSVQCFIVTFLFDPVWQPCVRAQSCTSSRSCNMCRRSSWHTCGMKMYEMRRTDIAGAGCEKLWPQK